MAMNDFGTSIGRLTDAILRNLIREEDRSMVSPSEAFLAHLGEYDPQQREALLIAAAALLSAVEERKLPDGSQKLVLNAGMRNFREPWARDFGFASYGLLALEELQPMRETLEVFFLFQKENGQFPVKVHSTSILARTLYSIFNQPQPITKPLRPKYISGHNSRSPDGNALLVSAAVNYARASNDLDFLKAGWPQLESALGWLDSLAPGRDKLISQGPYSDWADTIARTGKVLYTNVVYWKALDDMATMAEQSGFQVDGERYLERADLVSTSIQQVFWNDRDGYYVTSEEFDSLDTSGNLLAVNWGCSSSENSHRILDAIAARGLDSPVPTKPVSAPYPRDRIALEARLGGFPDYHIDAAWLWIGAWHVIAFVRMGRLQEASELLDRLAHVIVRDGNVYEVYETTGEPFSNFFYKSEAPLTWSAGMLVYAFKKFHEGLHVSV